MAINAATISAISALAGSGIGALASVATSWFTHHSQTRSQRIKQEAARRERLFSAFVDQSSHAYADAIVRERLDDPVALVPLFSTINKLRLFARRETVASAEAVLEKIVHTYESPQTASELRTKEVGAHDILREFADSCRTELREIG